MEEPTQPKKRGKLKLAVTGLLLLSAAGGAGYAYVQNFIHEQLSPLIAKELTKILNRPVQLGEVTGVSLNHLEFGATQILPTKNDPDPPTTGKLQITVPKIIVNFNPIQALLERQINLKVTAVRPRVLLQQAPNTNWLPTHLNIPEPQPNSLIKIEFQSLQVEEALVTLRARDGQKKLNPPVQVKIKNGEAQFSAQTEPKLAFNLTGALASEGNLQIKGQVNLKTFVTTVNLIGSNLAAQDVSHIIPLPLTLLQGNLDANLNLNYQPKKTHPVEIIGTAQLHQITARLKQLPQPFSQAEGSLKFTGSKITLEGVNARFGSIKAKATGNLDLVQGYQLTAQTEPFSLQDALKAFKVKAPSLVTAGKVRAQIQLTGKLRKPNIALQVQSNQALQIDRLALSGFQAKASIKDYVLNLQQWQARPSMGGLLQGNGQAVLAPGAKSNFTLNFQALQVPADSLARLYALALPTKIGLIQVKGQIRGNLETAQQLKITGQVQSNIAGGQVNLDNLQYESQSGHWQVEVKAEKIQLASFNLLIPQGQARANLQIAGIFQPNLVQSLEINGNASLNLAQNSTIQVNQLSFSKGRWKTQIKAENIALASLNPKISPLLRDPSAQADGNFNLTGSLDAPLQTVQGNGSATIISTKGRIRVNRLNLSAGNFQAQANLEDIRLASFSPQLRGKLNGEVQLQGNLANLTPQGIDLQGDLTFSEGISIIDRTLNTRFSWQGLSFPGRLKLQQISAKGLDVKGWLDIDPGKINQGIVALEEVSLNIVARHLNLQDLPPLPPALAKVKYQGWLDFTGAVRGTVKNPYIEGKIALERGIIGPLSLDSVLNGTIRAAPNAGVNLRLTGSQDNIALALNSRYQLQAILLQLQPVKLRATMAQNQLQLQVGYLSLAWLKRFVEYSPVAIPQNLLELPLAGDFSGNFKVDLRRRELVSDNLLITNPLLGLIKGDRLSGNISFLGGNLILSKGILKIKQTQYELNGLLRTTGNLAFQADAKIIQGNIGDILETLQIFEISDFSRGLKPPVYGKADSLYTPGQSTDTPLFDIGKPEAKILNQLRRYSEIKTLLSLEQQRRKDKSPLPELGQLKGNFDGQFHLNGSLLQIKGINAQFSFSGKDWQWDNININEVLAKGKFNQGHLTLEPVKVQVGESLLSFVGGFGNDSQMGELQLVKIPISLIKNVVNLPPTLNVEGVLNAKFLIAGSRDNPQAKGEMVVLNGNINQTSIESTQGTFNYNNSRLDFLARSVLSAGTPPLTLQGSFPYRLPFAKKIPLSPQFTANVNLRDNGLMLLNILTREQLRWLGGRGTVDISVGGAFDSTNQQFSQVRADGLINLEDGTIAAQFIPDAPLTKINGKISLNFDRINVQQLTAKFSGSQVNIAGSLPLVETTVPPQQPLTVSFDGLAFNLKGLYRGGLEGQFIVTGTVLNPHLGGKINLFDGQVFLGNLISEGTQINSGTTPSNLGGAIEFNNLQLNLKKNIQLTQPPVLSFLATGGMTLNGSLEEPQPEGTITLKSGLINLFAAQFRLAGGSENTAQFFPFRGLDPYLNIRLSTSASETSHNTLVSNNLSSEINDPFKGNTDALQTIRIEATVQGYASQLEHSITLTSVPSRSSTEIVSLLGGGLINGSGDPTLGLVNLAGSALLGSFQESLGSALGLTEFRIFPTQVIDSKYANQTGIAAEIGVDLSPKLFFSVQQILNIDVPAQFGLRYRINDNLLIRSSSNFSNDSRAVIEYETRF